MEKGMLIEIGVIFSLRPVGNRNLYAFRSPDTINFSLNLLNPRRLYHVLEITGTNYPRTYRSGIIAGRGNDMKSNTEEDIDHLIQILRRRVNV